MYKLEFLPIAKRDMDDIIYYISNTLNNKKAASALAQSFINSANSILNFPYGSSACHLGSLKYEYNSANSILNFPYGSSACHLGSLKYEYRSIKVRRK